MSSSGYWADLTTADLDRFDRDRTVVVFPVAAIEQHGPHLPLATDAIISRGIVESALRHCSDEVTVLVLPCAEFGHSVEHMNFDGTLSLDAEILLSAWCTIGASVAAAGFRRLVIVNSHGGQRALVDLAAVRLRADAQMLVARANYFSFGVPQGLFDDEEVRLGIHGGEVETSLLLHLAPQLVRRDRLDNFAYRDGPRARNDTLSYEKPVGLGWLSEDLSDSGVVGNARSADAQRGRRYLDYLGVELVKVCREMLNVQLPESSAR